MGFFSSEDKSMRKKHNRHQFKNVNEFLMPRNFLSKLGVFWIKRKRISPTDPRVVKVAVLLITVVLPSGVWKISLIRHITDRKTNETNKLMWMAFLWQCNLLKQKEIERLIFWRNHLVICQIIMKDLSAERSGSMMKC